MNIETARQKITSPSAEEIIKSAITIGESGTLADLQSLIVLVKHENLRIKAAAVNGATALILSNLLIRFSELDPQMRAKLGTIMESLDPAILDEITKEIYSEDETRRLRAVQILGLLKKNPGIRDVLAKLVQDRDVKIRATAVNLLGKTVGPNDQTIIMSLLNDGDKRVRANTVEALESLGNKRLVPVLLRFRKDPSNRIRGNVLKALYNLGFTDIEDDLLGMINCQDNFMRASALWVITSVKFITKKLEDASGYCLLSDNEMVLTNSRKALSSLCTPRCLGFLKYLGALSSAASVQPKPLKPAEPPQTAPGAPATPLKTMPGAQTTPQAGQASAPTAGRAPTPVKTAGL